VSSFDPDDAKEERAGTVDAAREEKMTWPTYLDTNGKWLEAQKALELPTFLVLGKDGRVVFRHHGKLSAESPAFAAMEKAIEQAIAAP
jgi:hypothetical protein